MVTWADWMGGISTFFLMTLGWIFGTIMIVRARKQKSRVWLFFGLCSIFFGMANVALNWFFVMNVLELPPYGYWTYTVFSEVDPLRVSLSLAWAPFLFYFGILVGAEFLFKKTIKIIIHIFFILTTIAYELLLYLDFSNNFTTSDEDGLLSFYTVGSPVYWIVMIWAVLVIIVNGVGLFIKAMRARGLVRWKLLSISIGFISTIAIIGIFQGLSKPGVMLLMVRLVLVGAWVLIYYGVVPRRVKKKKKKEAQTPEEAKYASYILGKSPTKKAPTEITGENKPVTRPKQDISVFVSHSNKDEELFKILDIVHSLKQFDDIHDVLIYEEDKYDNFIKYMNDHVGSCDAMILFCSQASIDSKYVEKEWTAAEAAGIPIIPVFYDQNHIPPLLKPRVGVELDFYDFEGTVEELHDVILKKCNI